MDITGIKAAKITMEAALTTAVRQFEATTSVLVTSIQLSRTNSPTNPNTQVFSTVIVNV